MTVQELMQVSIERARRWHGGDINQWSPLEWAGAMCGEAGECANAAKKLKRLQDGIASINEVGRSYSDFKAVQHVVAKEVCDVVLYAVLVAASVGIRPAEFQELLAEVFNRKSEEYGFPERLEHSVGSTMDMP
jgi:NTP pyrophosphatase (non-canonical NTP hydrolase)